MGGKSGEHKHRFELLYFIPLTFRLDIFLRETERHCISWVLSCLIYLLKCPRVVFFPSLTRHVSPGFVLLTSFICHRLPVMSKCTLALFLSVFTSSSCLRLSYPFLSHPQSSLSVCLSCNVVMLTFLTSNPFFTSVSPAAVFAPRC